MQIIMAEPRRPCETICSAKGGGLVLTRLENREIAHRTRHLDPGRAGLRPRPDLPPGTDLLPQIRHIVVLMMENHSYDNYLGMLAGRGAGFTPGPGGEPLEATKRSDGSEVRAHHLATTKQVPHIPTQSWHASHLQYDGGRCDGFVRSVEETVLGAAAEDAAIPMGYWTEQDLPFYYGLARTFPLADRWFCSCLGPTFPNRRFLLAGTAHGLVDDLPFAMVDYPPGGTVFDMLTSHGITWVNYHSVRPARLILQRALGGGGLIALRRLVSLGRWFPPLVRAVKGNKTCTADLYPLGLARCLLHLRPMARFFADADAGTLPAFCIVDPDFDTFSEENPQDIRYGESFAAEVITRVMRGKGWPHTLLIWLYDEHGGYYDHVPPPAAPPPDGVPGRSLLTMPGWLHAALKPFFAGYFASVANLDTGPHRYDRYGFRVPAVIVSPYARPGYVTSEVFDHTSVLKLLGHKWNLPPLTDRDAAAKAPLDALDLDGEPAFRTPPDLPAPRLAWGSW
jgi:phospholipase C